MGMCAPVCELLLFENSVKKLHGNVLFIGRQDIFLTEEALRQLLARFNTPIPAHAFIEKNPARPHLITDKSFMSFFEIDSLNFMDVSDYEGADIVWDLGYPVDEALHRKFDFIYNGSCLDNMFNPAVAMFNLTKMLKDNGRILHLEHATSYNGPYLMFPPSWIFDYYVQNGFADCKVYTGQFNEPQDLFYGPWALSFFDWQHNPNGHFPPGINMFIVGLAEKKADATSERQPIQQRYRVNEKAAQIYNSNIQVIDKAARPIYLRGAKNNSTNAELIPLGMTASLFPVAYPPI